MTLIGYLVEETGRQLETNWWHGDYPFNFLFHPAYGYLGADAVKVWFWRCGILLCLILAGFVLSPLFKGSPQRKILLLCAIWPMWLADLAMTLRDNDAASYIFFHTMVPLAICAALAVREIFREFGIPPSRARRYRLLILAGLSLVPLGICIAIGKILGQIAEGSRAFTLKFLAGVPFVSFAIDLLRSFVWDPLMLVIGGQWMCLVILAAMLFPPFRKRRYWQRPFFTILWSAYLFDLSLAFWVRGYSIRAFVFVFIPMIVAICLTVWNLCRIHRDRDDQCRSGFFTFVLLALVAQLWMLFCEWLGIDFHAFGASC